jgi:hypothetical protein
VKSHLRKLVSLEYVLVHHGGRGRQFVYELLYNGEGKDGSKFLMCLIDVKELREKCGCDQNREHSNTDRVQKSVDREHENPKQEVPGSIRGAPGELSGSMPKKEVLPNETKSLNGIPKKSPENAYIGDIKNPPQSYHSHTSLAAKEN